MQNKEKEVTLFGAEWCPACKTCKDWLDKNKIEYRYVDVEKDRDEFLMLGARAIPVIKINDTMIVGFSLEKIKAALS